MLPALFNSTLFVCPFDQRFPHFGFSRYFNLHNWVYFQVQSSKSGCRHPAGTLHCCEAHISLSSSRANQQARQPQPVIATVSRSVWCIALLRSFSFSPTTFSPLCLLFVFVALPFSADDQFAHWKFTFSLANFPAFAVLSWALCLRPTYASPHDCTHTHMHMVTHAIFLADVRFLAEFFKLIFL